MRINNDNPNDDRRRGINGLLGQYVNRNANPRSMTLNNVEKICDRIRSILDSTALTLKGVVSDPDVVKSLTPYEDFFEKGHSEELTINDTVLLISIKFTPPGILKLGIQFAPKPKVEPTPEETTKSRIYGDSGERFSIDKICCPSRIGLEPVNVYGLHMGTFATIEHNVLTMTLLGEVAGRFAYENGLVMYTSASLREGGLEYLFIDQDNSND